ncbi:hypothetical protein ISCGN_029798 [Ixodes scapularis]
MALKWQGDAPVAAFVVVSVGTFMAISMTPPLLYVIMITCNAALSVAFWFLVRRALSPVRDLPVDAKAVFVTGSLRDKGLTVYAGCLDPDSEGARLLRTSGVRVFHVDYLRHDTLVGAYAGIRDAGTGLWAIVACAGQTTYGELEWTPCEELVRVIDVNVLGTLELVSLGLGLVKASRGRIVVFTGLHGRLSIPGMAVPSAASAALCQYADGLRREMVKFGVQVCTVEPAFYRTGTTDRDAVSTALDSLTKRMDPSVREAYGESYLETFRSSFPKRLWRFSRGDLDEVSDAVLGALLSPEANVRYRCCSWRQVFTWAVLELLPRRIGDYFMLVQFTPRYRVMAAAPRSPPDLTSVEQSHVDVLRDLYGSPPRSPFGSGSPPAQVDASQTTRP